ncbi:MAG: PAS domain S-box protein [Ghiorsea sp.]
MFREGSVDFLNKNYATAFMAVGLLITIIMFAWAYASSQQLLRQQAPLIDTVMQLRVDLSQTHQLIHESSDSQTFGKEDVHTAITQLNTSINALYQGSVQLEDISGDISGLLILETSLIEIQRSINELSDYLQSEVFILELSSTDTLDHDGYFGNAEMLAEELDEQVHHSVTQAIKSQSNVFSVLFVIGISLIIILIFLLRKTEQQKRSMMGHSLQLSQALEHSGEAVIIASAQGVIEFVNEAYCLMTGYSTQETLGNNPSMLSSGKQNKSFYDNLWNTIRAGKVWRGELTNKKKDGTLYPALMTIAPIIDNKGELTHFIANQRDISEHAALEEHLFQAQKLEAIGTLASGIAHDFNNSLAAITGTSYLLKKYAGDKEQVLKRVSVIEEVCGTAASHIKQILCYARNDSVLMSPLELNQCVQRSCDVVNKMIPATVELKFVPHHLNLYVHWNENQVQQILINLINNARHALVDVESPKITLQVKLVDQEESFMGLNNSAAEEQYICLSIEDNGSGMSKEIMAQIFDPFFTTKVADEGTGLGLSMAYGAIKRAGGGLFVDSNVGIGTTFYICLPIKSPEEVEVTEKESRIYFGSGETILLADDEKHLLKSQQEVIQSFGYKVLTATNGKEAIEMYEKYAEEISLVILDMVMPSLSGLKAAKHIKQRNPEAKIIMSTGYSMEDAPDRKENDIQAPVIYKPYSPESMSKLIFENIKK